MNIEKFDSVNEKLILISFITDKKVLSQILPVYQNDMMGSTASNLITSWCFNFYQKYNEAPKQNIMSFFSVWAEKSKDKESIETIGSILEHINDMYLKNKEGEIEEQNSQYMVDLISKHINKVKLEKTIEMIQGELFSGNVDKAWERIRTVKRAEVGKDVFIDLFNNPGPHLKKAFDRKKTPLIQYADSPLSEFFGESFTEDTFIVFCGAEKRGKSLWLLDIAYRAAQQRKKTLYFQVGDLSESDITYRFSVRMARRSRDEKPYNYPVSIERLKDQEEAEVIYEIRKHEDMISENESKIAYATFVHGLKSKSPIFKLSHHSNFSINALDIKRRIQRAIEECEFVPQVVVIDYADNLLPVVAKREKRHEIEETYSILRSISTEFNVLLITATQADAASYHKRTIDISNFSESKTKNAHASAIIGINQMPSEKEKGIYRLNYPCGREVKYAPHVCVHIAGCREINNPVIGKLSTW